MAGFRIVLHTVLYKSKKYYYIRNRMTSFFPCLVLFNTVFIGFHIYIVPVILPECFSKWQCVSRSSTLQEAGWQGTVSFVPECSSGTLRPQVGQGAGLPRMEGKYVSPRQAPDFIESDKKSLMTTPNRKGRQKEPSSTEQLALNLLN